VTANFPQDLHLFFSPPNAQKQRQETAQRAKSLGLHDPQAIREFYPGQGGGRFGIFPLVVCG
jgi:hypothetical protein